MFRWLSSLRSQQYPRPTRPMLENLEHRLNPTTTLPSPGLVSSFGNGGTVLTSFFDRTDSGGYGAIVQADGKVVAVGTVGADPSSGNGFLVLRYNADGSPDMTFGPNHDGQVLTTFAGPAGATAVALESDGKILVAGYTADAAGDSGDFALARYNTNGSLDTSFGTGGVVTTSFAALGAGAVSEANSIVIDSTGRIVLGGSTAASTANTGIAQFAPGDFALARYTASGSLDKTFGTGGLVVTNFAGKGEGGIDAVALDAQGRIVAAGLTVAGQDSTGEPAKHFALARYNTNGSLDKTFGTAGEVTTKVAAGNQDTINAMVIRPSGKIVVAGSTYNPTTHRQYSVLARYTTAGSLDTAFGSGGTVVTDIGNHGASGIHALMLDAQGRLVAAGFASTGTALNIAVARYNSNGTLDTTFGTGGEATSGFKGTLASALAIAPGHNGQFVLAGAAIAPVANASPAADLVLERYNSSGSLDTSFGTSGQVRFVDATPVKSTLEAVTAQPDGKLIVVGGLGGTANNLAIRRLNKNGTTDTTFGTNGEVVIPFMLFGSPAQVSSVVVEPNGKILVAATTGPVGSLPGGYLALLRFNADGSVDTGFGVAGQTVPSALPVNVSGPLSNIPVAGIIVQSGGKILVGAGAGGLALFQFNRDGSLATGLEPINVGSSTTPFSDAGNSTIALQPDGKIVIGGSVKGHLVLMRYNADGSVDKTFGTGGVVQTNLMAFGVAGMVFQSGGKIVVLANGGTQNDFFLVRFNASGSLDRTFGTSGVVLANAGNNVVVSSVVIDSAGRIVLAGHGNTSATASTVYAARYSANGQLDTKFASGGKLLTSFAGGVADMVLEPAGTLVVAGTSNLPSNDSAIALTEYTTGS